jgi:zinc protease
MKRLTLLFLFVVLYAAGYAQVLPVDPDIRYGKLENGLTYYIRHNNQPENRADFYIAQKVGSMQEEDSQAGLAHFLEHMAFNGTKNFPGRKTMLDYLEKNGAKFGVNVNAYTSFDETVYNLSDIPVIREGIIDSCLLILHDWSSFISLENEEIDKERSIIKEEWRTRSGAQIRIWDKQLPVIFKDSKYADRMPIGKMSVVENFEYSVLKDYYHKWYRPDLQAIIVVGDIDVDQVENKIKTLFADIPKPVNPAERIYYPVPDNEAPIVSVVTDPEASNTLVTLYMKHDVLPAGVEKMSMQEYFLFVVKSLATQMLSNRFTEIAQKPDAPFAGTYVYDGSFFVSKTKDAWTTMALAKEGQVKETLASLFRENERVKRFGFTNAEVERAKVNLLKNYENSYNNRNTQHNKSYVQEYVRSFTDDEAIPGIEYEYNMVQQFAPMITADIINQIIEQFISEKNLIITVTGPEKAGLTYPSETELLNVLKEVEQENITAYAEEAVAESLMETLPAKGSIVKEEKDPHFDATVWTLSNGMKVVLKKTDFKDDQILMSSISYGGLSWVDDSDIYNGQLASIMPSIGGIGNFNVIDLRKVLTGKNAHVNSVISNWTQGFSGSSSIKDQETLLQLTYLSFTAPRKDTEAYEATLSRIKNQLKNQDADPRTAFSDSITHAIYMDSPRAKKMEMADADKLDYDRMLSIYKQSFANPGSFVFVFVGTVDETTLRPLVEQYLASLPAGNKDAKYRELNLPKRSGEYRNIFTKGMQTPKASVFNQYRGFMDRNQKNVMTLSALKQVLDIVYVRTVREEEGGTYGVGAGALVQRIPNGETILQISFDTDPVKADKLNAIVHRELKKIAESGPEDVDLQKVKEYMAKKYQEDQTQNGYWSDILSTYYFYNEDDNTDYMSILNSITGEDVKNLTQKLLSQGNLIEVIMQPEENK